MYSGEIETILCCGGRIKVPCQWIIVCDWVGAERSCGKSGSRRGQYVWRAGAEGSIYRAFGNVVASQGMRGLGVVEELASNRCGQHCSWKRKVRGSGSL